MDEALENIREAIGLHIESLIAHGEDLPEDYAAKAIGFGDIKITL